MIFTALHRMQKRSSDVNSVRPSVKRVNCDKTEERYVQIFIPYERSFSLVFLEEEWLVPQLALTNYLVNINNGLCTTILYCLMPGSGFFFGPWPISSSSSLLLLLNILLFSNVVFTARPHCSQCRALY